MTVDFKSFELWRGPSWLTDEPVVALASGIGQASLNPKTGDAVQVYFLRADMSPSDAVRARDTRAICGECLHAPHRDGTCYVNPFYAAENLWQSWAAGGCPPLHRDFWPSRLGSRFLRLGAYGDPAAGPDELSLDLAAAADGHAGYTHAWRDRPALRTVCMASVSGEAELAEAEAEGWRGFQVLAMDHRNLRYLEPVPAGSVACGASVERGKRTTCAACRACGGTSSKARASIVVGAHGRSAGKLAALRGLGRTAARSGMMQCMFRHGASVPDA